MPARTHDRADVTAEAIARVVADLRADRVRMTGDFADLRWKDPIGILGGPTVDATAIYHDLVNRPRPVALYEDHPCIAPPWETSTIGYVNEHGNVIAMVTFVDPDTPQWDTAEPVEWDRVKWRLSSLVFLGGRSPAVGPFPTSGPMMLFAAAVYEDGTPADLHWEHLEPRYPREHWDMAHLVLLGALNFMNCRNVDLVEPRRPRAEARRIARTGVTVSTINVFPIGRSTRGASRSADPVGVPLTSVRGHFSCYGPAYDRGLLFGRYEGRYWIPQHARGAAEHGQADHDYALQPEAIP